MKQFTRISIYIPVGDGDDLPLDEIASMGAVADITALLRSVEFAGEVGAYRAVIEMTDGLESFVPALGSRPIHGRRGTPSRVRSVRLVTYIPADTDSHEVAALIERLAVVHPWEHPVIEVDRVELWMPSGGM